MEKPNREVDIEKSTDTLAVSLRSNSSEHTAIDPAAPIPFLSKFRTWNHRIENLTGLEARGIKRVYPEERHAASVSADAQMAMMWFSANISANNLAVGLLGPLLFGLGFVDSAMCAFGGILIGAAATAYMSIWGAQSGNRTMVSRCEELSPLKQSICLIWKQIVLRYFMGYWPAKLPCVLNMILMIGYGTIDCIIGGQILSAVSGDSMSVVVGIVIVALISWVIAVFGMAIFQKYER